MHAIFVITSLVFEIVSLILMSSSLSAPSTTSNSVFGNESGALPFLRGTHWSVGTICTLTPQELLTVQTPRLADEILAERPETFQSEMDLVRQVTDLGDYSEDRVCGNIGVPGRDLSVRVSNKTDRLSEVQKYEKFLQEYHYTNSSLPLTKEALLEKKNLPEEKSNGGLAPTSLNYMARFVHQGESAALAILPFPFPNASVCLHCARVGVEERAMQVQFMQTFLAELDRFLTHDRLAPDMDPVRYCASANVIHEWLYPDGELYGTGLLQQIRPAGYPVHLYNDGDALFCLPAMKEGRRRPKHCFHSTAAIFRMLAALPAQDLEMHCDCCVNVPDAFLHARRECLENESTLPQFMKSLQSCNDTAHKLLPLVAAAIASRDVEFFRWFVSSMISPVLGLWQGSWQYWAWRLSALMGSIPMLGYCDAAMFAAPFDTMYWAVCSTDVAVVKWCHEHGFLFNQSAAVLALEAGAKDIVEYMWHGHPKDCAMYCCRHPKSCLGRSPFIPEPVCAVMCVATLNADLLTWYFECGGTADERCWTLFQAQVYAFVAMAALGGFHRRGRVNEGADLYFPTYSAEDPTDGEYMLRGIQMAYEAGVLAAPGDALKAQVSSKLRAVFHCLLEHRVAYSTGTYEFCQVAREGCLWDVHRHIPFSGFMDVSVLRGDVETWGLAVCKNCDDFSWVDEGVVPDAGGVPWKTPEETDEGALWVNPPPNGGARVPLLVPSSSSSSFTPMTDESKDDEEEVFAQPRGLSAERAEVLREMTTQSRQRLFYAAQMKVLREAIFEAWPPTKLCNGIVVTPGEQVVTLVMEFAFAVSAREGAYRQFARRFFNETGKRRDVEVLFEFEDEYAVECTPTCRAIQAGEHPPLPSRLPPATLERMMSLGSTVWTFAPGGWCRRPACFHPLYKHRYQAEKEGVVLKKRKTGV